MGYVVTKLGTFGTIGRWYINDALEQMATVVWGPLRLITPVRAEDIHQLDSPYEEEARKEAIAWVKSIEEGRGV